MPRNISLNELNKSIAAIEASLNKKPDKKGAKVMADIDLAPNTYFLRRPSGIISLDVDTGGGLPAGGLIYASGPDGAGKTFLMYKYAAMNQKLLGEHSAVALGVSEAAPDHFFMRKCGMQIAIPEDMIAERVAARKTIGLPPFTKDQLKEFRAKTVGQVKILRGATGEELLAAILTCFESRKFDIVTCDSISAVLPEADASKDLDENQKRAAAAGLLTKFFQHYLNGTTGYLNLNPTTVIFTSQVRSNSKKAEAPAHIQKYLPDYVAVGAWAAKHGKLIDILVKPGKKAKEVMEVGRANSLGEMKQVETRVQTGKLVQYEITKGKAGVHEGIAGEFDFHFPKDSAEMYDLKQQLTDDQYDLVVTAIAIGLVQDRDGFLTFHDASRNPIPALLDVPGATKAAELLRNDFELELIVRYAVLSMSGISCAYR